MSEFHGGEVAGFIVYDRDGYIESASGDVSDFGTHQCGGRWRNGKQEDCERCAVMALRHDVAAIKNVMTSSALDIPTLARETWMALWGEAYDAFGDALDPMSPKGIAIIEAALRKVAR